MSDAFNMNDDENEPTRPRRMLPWLLILAVVVIGGAFIWANNHAGKNSSPVAANQSGAQQASASPGETKQALASLQQAVNDLKSARQQDADQIADLQRQLSAEEGERKLLSDQVSALSGRVDGLEKARAEVRAPTNRRHRR